MLNGMMLTGIAFGLTTIITLYFFYRATNHRKIFLVIAAVWLLVQGAIALSGFYIVTHTVPPRFLLLVAPPLLLIAALFFTKSGRQFIDGLDLKYLTLLHAVRVPVELVLFSLFIHRYVPELMTFEGRNLDILSGLTAPVIYYFVFVSKRFGYRALLAWNIVCLLLLFNIVTHAILSSPTVFQQLAFDQPNVGVLYFPFVFLPAIVVPLVLFSHLAALRQLLTLQVMAGLRKSGRQTDFKVKIQN